MTRRAPVRFGSSEAARAPVRARRAVQGAPRRHPHPARTSIGRVSTPLSVTTESPATIAADAVVVGYYEGESGPVPAPGAHEVDAAFSGGLAAALHMLGAGGSVEEIHQIPSMGAIAAPLVAAVGLGPEPPPEDGAVDRDVLSRAAGAALRALHSGKGRERVVLALPAESAETAEAAALGAALGNYSYLRYRTGENTARPVSRLLVASGAEGADAAVARAAVLAEATCLARDLVNAAPADLTPQRFAEIAEEVGRESGLAVEVLAEEALAEGGYGGLTAVGQGSANPPRLVRLAYQAPSGGADVPTVSLVGKGITFDSGGLSLKPASAMEWMKSDMGGAAAVLGAMRAIAALRLEINVVGHLALAENMPGGSAQRPSDVITIYGGKTVEVLNTDAEGRLVLADALVRAQEDEPDLLVDAATLTGAQLVALGTRVFAVMANEDAVREGVVAAAARAGEAAWPMPLPDDLRSGLDSSVADIANVAGERWGGMLSAGIFLREFVEAGVGWAHLDIAGPAFNQGKPHGHTPKGGTGAATRTLVGIVEAHAGH